MISSASIRNAYFNLERLSRSFRLARPVIFDIGSTLALFGAALNQAPNSHVPNPGINYYKIFCKQFARHEHFSPFESVRVKGRMSLWNGIWHGLRNDIIMRNVIYTE